MWGLAAAFGPVGWVVAAVGTAATAYALMDDDDDEYTYSNKDEKEAEVKTEAREEKRRQIKQDIKIYKKQQKEKIKAKYNIDIKFVSKKINIIEAKDSTADSIVLLEKETREMINFVDELKAMKHEAIS